MNKTHVNSLKKFMVEFRKFGTVPDVNFKFEYFMANLNFYGGNILIFELT
jgi:hypothetical protein